jgi:hypothetical protein
MKDLKEFDGYFSKIKLEIYEKFTDDPGVEPSEDVTKGFQNFLAYLDQKLIKAGRQPFIKVVSQQNLDVTNIESLGTKLFHLFDNQFEGNESERKGKLYEFIELMKDEVISAYKSTSEDSDIKKNDDMIASINAHSKAVQHRDAEII